MVQQKIIILDFGSQTTQLIGRRLRELDTFCEIVPYNKFPYEDEGIIGVFCQDLPTAYMIPAHSKWIYPISAAVILSWESAMGLNLWHNFMGEV